MRLSHAHVLVLLCANGVGAVRLLYQGSGFAYQRPVRQLSTAKLLANDGELELEVDLILVGVVVFVENVDPFIWQEMRAHTGWWW